MYNAVANELLYTAYRLTTSFELRDDNKARTKTGTAFFVRGEDGTKYLFTNRHMADIGYGEPAGKFIGAKLASVRVEGLGPEDGELRSLPNRPISLDLVAPVERLRFADNYFEDVACFVDPRIKSEKEGPRTIHYTLNQREFADDSWIESNLLVCDFVAFPGFPPWHDKLANRPILRTGTLSSDPRTNYSDEPMHKGRRIAYEAFSFGGSSGSPVVAPSRGLQGGDGIVASGYREAKVIGINAGHFSADHGAHSGVSYLIKSSAILDLIRRWPATSVC